MENNILKVNIKLAKARAELQNKNLRMTGENKYSNYKYFQLSDFLPSINLINAEIGLLSFFTFGKEQATLDIIDCDTGTKLTFSMPSCHVELKGAMAIQMIGAQQTYLRRYLFTVAYEISENDLVENVAEMAEKEKQEKERLLKEKRELEEFEKNKRQQKEVEERAAAKEIKAKEQAIKVITKLVGDDFDLIENQLKYHKIESLNDADSGQLKQMHSYIKKCIEDKKIKEDLEKETTETGTKEDEVVETGVDENVTPE